MRRVGEWILRVLRAPEDAAELEQIRSEVREFASDYRVPGV